MSDALRLPLHPNLEQYKKLARDLQGACKSSGPDAVRGWAARWVDALAALSPGPPSPRQRESQIEQLVQHWSERTKKDTRPCTLTAAQFFIAREHGFSSWPKFARHVREMARAGSTVSVFEAAADAIVAGDAPTLRRLLAEFPGLARDRSTREHRSTLLHYVSANGVEDFRQKTPRNIIEIANLLLDSGADVNAESEAYGGGCTTLGLVATSVHPEQAGVQIPLLQALLDRGATFHQPSAGGNNHTIVHACIANGQPKAAEFFANLGAPLDLESAAALGRLDVLEEYLDQNGAPQTHLDARQLESAFLYACGYGSRAAAEFLLTRGVPPAARNNEGETGLHWAGWGAHADVVRLLLEHGAPVDAKDNGFHAIPLDMALWTWDHTSDSEERERCYETIALLARAGAKLDREHWSSPQGVASGMLGKIDADPRLLAALRGDTGK